MGLGRTLSNSQTRLHHRQILAGPNELDFGLLFGLQRRSELPTMPSLVDLVCLRISGGFLFEVAATLDNKNTGLERCIQPTVRANRRHNRAC